MEFDSRRPVSNCRTGRCTAKNHPIMGFYDQLAESETKSDTTSAEPFLGFDGKKLFKDRLLMLLGDSVAGIGDNRP